MDEKQLRRNLIKLAYENPDIRPQVLPILQRTAKAGPEWWESHHQGMKKPAWYVKKERGKDPVYFLPVEAERDGSLRGYMYVDDEAKRNRAKKGKIRKSDFSKWKGIGATKVPMRARNLIERKVDKRAALKTAAFEWAARVTTSDPDPDHPGNSLRVDFYGVGPSSDTADRAVRKLYRDIKGFQMSMANVLDQRLGRPQIIGPESRPPTDGKIVVYGRFEVDRAEAPVEELRKLANSLLKKMRYKIN